MRLRCGFVAAVVALSGPHAVAGSKPGDPSHRLRPQARIVVHVTDESGAPLNGAAVSARLTWQTKASAVATSTADGKAELRGLVEDESYVVRVASVGYADAEVDVVPARLQESEAVAVRLSEDLCDLAVMMDFRDSRQLIDPDSAKTSTVFTSWFLAALPGGGGSERILPEECAKKAEKRQRPSASPVSSR